MDIADRIQKIEEEIAGKAKLVAVSKRQPDEKILEALDHGFKRYGENYVQELIGKYERLPKSIEWHMIGHLQTNKVKYIAPFVSMIHSVDSFRLLKEIDKQAAKCNRIIPVLLQVHIAEEDTKTGMSSDELADVFETMKKSPLMNVSVQGLMGMSTFTDDMEVVSREFSSLKQLFDRVKLENPQLPITELSMGMSGDWPLAISLGSTLIRVGSAIFGERS